MGGARCTQRLAGCWSGRVVECCQASFVIIWGALRRHSSRRGQQRMNRRAQKIEGGCHGGTQHLAARTSKPSRGHGRSAAASQWFWPASISAGKRRTGQADWPLTSKYPKVGGCATGKPSRQARTIRRAGTTLALSSRDHGWIRRPVGLSAIQNYIVSSVQQLSASVDHPRRLLLRLRPDLRPSNNRLFRPGLRNASFPI